MMTHKVCCQCTLSLLISAFGKRKHSKDGLRSECKSCRKQDRFANLDYFIQADKKSRDKNKEKRRVKSIAYYHSHIEQKKSYDQEYYATNKAQIISKHNVRDKIKRKENPNFRLRGIISIAIGDALKKNGKSKNGDSSLKYLPYTIQELREYLEAQFEPWMTWDNWGVYNSKTWDDNDLTTWKWQLDHIIPHSTFQYVSMEDQAFRDCWALSNLRPLSAKQNLLDGVNRSRHISI